VNNGINAPSGAYSKNMSSEKRQRKKVPLLILLFLLILF